MTKDEGAKQESMKREDSSLQVQQKVSRITGIVTFNGPRHLNIARLNTWRVKNPSSEKSKTMHLVFLTRTQQKPRRKLNDS